MDEVYTSVLFTGLTRPAMFLGVTIEYVGIELIVTMLTWLFLGNLFYAVIIIPLHIFGWVCCLIDPHTFTILLKRLQWGLSPNRALWGGMRYEAR